MLRSPSPKVLEQALDGIEKMTDRQLIAAVVEGGLDALKTASYVEGQIQAALLKRLVAIAEKLPPDPPA